MKKKTIITSILTIAVLLVSAVAIFSKNVDAEQETAKKALSSEEKQAAASDTEKRIDRAKSKMLEAGDDKHTVYEKMLNSMDYFETVQGSFEMKELGEVSFVEYAADFQGSYAEENVSGENVSFQTVTNNGETITYDHKARNYLKTPVMEEDDFVAELPVEERTQVDDETGQPVWYYRTNMTGFSYAKESLFPQERTFGYLYDFESWNIAEKEEIAGRTCWRIEGELSGSYSEKLNVKSYIFFVDTQTGCLLKYEGYDCQGGLTEYIETKEIEFDAPLAIAYEDAGIPEGYTDWAAESLKLLDGENE